MTASSILDLADETRWQLAEHVSVQDRRLVRHPCQCVALELKSSQDLSRVHTWFDDFECHLPFDRLRLLCQVN